MGSVVNTIQHGGQVGMVFEMYRNNAGFFKMMQESIESNLNERDVDSRENGEVFEMKVALQLGRSLSELRDVAASSSRLGNDIQEFGSKLFWLTKLTFMIVRELDLLVYKTFMICINILNHGLVNLFNALIIKI